jgi:hypothetical protein
MNISIQLLEKIYIVNKLIYIRKLGKVKSILHIQIQSTHLLKHKGRHRLGMIFPKNKILLIFQ